MEVDLGLRTNLQSALSIYTQKLSLTNVFFTCLKRAGRPDGPDAHKTLTKLSWR